MKIWKEHFLSYKAVEKLFFSSLGVADNFAGYRVPTLLLLTQSQDRVQHKRPFSFYRFLFSFILSLSVSVSLSSLPLSLCLSSSCLSVSLSSGVYCGHVQHSGNISF